MSQYQDPPDLHELNAENLRRAFRLCDRSLLPAAFLDLLDRLSAEDRACSSRN